MASPTFDRTASVAAPPTPDLSTPDPSIPDPSTRSETLPPPGPDMRKVRRALRGGTLAYFVDQFDIYLPIVALAPALIFFEPVGASAATTSLLSSLVFASTLVARPLGSIIFGHFADTVGRKKTTLVAVAGFGVATLAIAALPGFAGVGYWSIGMLIALRFVGGIFLGGEYTTAVPLAMEWSPKHKRGLYSGLITFTSPGAYAVIAAITLVLLQVMPPTDLRSDYVQWGWRIPFVVGALLSAVLFAYYRRQVVEPPASTSGVSGVDTVRQVPLLRLLTTHPGALLQVFVLMTGAWLVTDMEAAVFPGQLALHVGLSSKQVTVTMLVLSVIAAASYPLFGQLSQKIGRRPFFIGYGLAVLVLGTGAYLVAVTSGPHLATVIASGAVLGLFSTGTYGAIAAYLTERFPSSIRATGYGVAYSTALVVPAFYAFYLRQLGQLMPSQVAPAVLLALGAALISLGGFLGPETRDLDMRRTEQSTAAR